MWTRHKLQNLPFQDEYPKLTESSYTAVDDLKRKTDQHIQMRYKEKVSLPDVQADNYKTETGKKEVALLGKPERVLRESS